MRSRKFSGMYCIDCDNLILRTDTQIYCDCFTLDKKDDKGKLNPIPKDKWLPVQIKIGVVHGGNVKHPLPLPLKKHIRKSNVDKTKEHI